MLTKVVANLIRYNFDSEHFSPSVSIYELRGKNCLVNKKKRNQQTKMYDVSTKLEVFIHENSFVEINLDGSKLQSYISWNVFFFFFLHPTCSVWNFLRQIKHDFRNASFSDVFFLDQSVQWQKSAHVSVRAPITKQQSLEMASLAFV